jgi:Reverse transcriptase (RNA-dependent DNA polymerase)
MCVKVVHQGKGDDSKQISLLEPASELLRKKGVSIGRILAEGPISEVYLTNFGRLPQRVDANCCLAKVEPITLEKAVPPSKSDITKADFLKHVNGELTEQEKLDLVEILMEESDCFARDGEALGQSSVFQHEIPSNSDCPIHVRPYASAWKERQLVEEQVRKMLKQKVIEPSISPWSAPVVLVKKKDGKWRFCVDYRKLNAVTTKTIYPLPRIDESLTRLKGSCYFSSIDLQSGYWPLSVRAEDQEKTAFTTADGHYQFRAMLFGLSGAAHTFQRAMDVILAGLKWTACLVYLDDVVVYRKDLQQHNDRLREVLRCLRSAGMKIKLSKCHFGETSLHILGHVVSEKGIAAGPDKLRAVECFPVPRNVKEVQSFLGLCSYFRKFVPKFSWIARPLTTLLKKNQKWQWQTEQKESFDLLKKNI